MSNIDVDITDKKQINNLIDGLERLQAYIMEADEKIFNDIGRKGTNYLDRQYKSSPNRLSSDIDLSDISITGKKSGDTYVISIKGKDIVYEEFGTGDEGQKHQHPVKSKYPLNAYNSGGTITNVKEIYNPAVLKVLSSHGINSGNFWFYPKGAEPVHYHIPPLDIETKQKRANALIEHSDKYNITQGVRAGKEVWNTRNYLLSNKAGIRDTIKKVGDDIDKIINSIT